MNKRENVYASYEDQNVKTVVVYANDSSVLFYDAEFKNPVLTSELLDLYLKGMVIVVNEEDVKSYVKVIICNEGKVTTVSGDGLTDFTATEPVEE